MGPISKKILFSGQVQGVGFRRKAFELSKRFSVAGYVRNLPTGHVELVVEGAPDEVERFLEAIKEKLASYIESFTVSTMPLQQFGEFTIRF